MATSRHRFPGRATPPPPPLSPRRHRAPPPRCAHRQPGSVSRPLRDQRQTDRARKHERAPSSGASHAPTPKTRSEEHTSELQSRENLVCRLLLEKKKKGIS